MNKKKRIIFVVSDFPVLSQTFIVNQIISVIKLNLFEVKIYCTGNVFKHAKMHQSIIENNLMNFAVDTPFISPDPSRRFFNVIGLLFKHYKNLYILLQSFNVFKYKRSSLNMMQFYKHLTAVYFKKNDFDIVHAHFGDNGVYINDVFNLIKKKNNLVVAFHGYDASNYERSYYKGLFSRKDVTYTSNTNYTKGKMIDLSCPDDQIEILPEVLDTKYFKSTNVDKDTILNITFVGRLINWKAPLLAIKIINKVISLGVKVKFNLVGDGEEMEACRSYVEKYGLSSSINILGNQTQENIKSILNQSHLFLFPGIKDKFGRCENQGLVIQEAQSMGVPVLVSDAGGMKEGVENGVNGYVLPEGDIDAFAEKIIYLNNNRKGLSNMGENSKEFVYSRYDHRELVNKLLKIYKNYK